MEGTSLQMHIAVHCSSCALHAPEYQPSIAAHILTLELSRCCTKLSNLMALSCCTISVCSVMLLAAALHSAQHRLYSNHTHLERLMLYPWLLSLLSCAARHCCGRCCAGMLLLRPRGPHHRHAAGQTLVPCSTLNSAPPAKHTYAMVMLTGPGAAVS
jgi:hypothetical protein